MSYVRFSLMKPLAGRDLEVTKLNLELVSLYRGQPGCISSQVIRATDTSGEVGRLSFWESESAADAAATGDHSMHLRSQLHLAVRRGRLDRSFHTEL